MATKSYQESLIEQLKSPQEAAEYLNACLMDSEDVFLLGLRNVVEAKGGIGKVSVLSGLNRENLYRSLSKKGNPRLSSLTLILEAVGISLQFSPTGKTLLKEDRAPLRKLRSKKSPSIKQPRAKHGLIKEKKAA